MLITMNKISPKNAALKKATTVGVALAASVGIAFASGCACMKRTQVDPKPAVPTAVAASKDASAAQSPAKSTHACKSKASCKQQISNEETI